MNDSRHTVLFVDDEENILHSLKRLLRKEGYQIQTATNGSDGLEILKNQDVHLVVTDQRMPGMSGTEFLAKAKEEFPDTIRIILTGYTEVDSITASINKGHIYKFFLKPWDDQNLRLELKQALEQYELIKANKRLNEEIIQKNAALKEINENLEILVQDRTKDLEVQNQALELSRVILDDLPFPIIGVSHEGMIVMLNKQAMELMYNKMGLEVGKRISNYFLGETLEQVIHTLETNTIHILEKVSFTEHVFDIFCTPLSGRFKGKGIVLTLRPSN